MSDKQEFDWNNDTKNQPENKHEKKGENTPQNTEENTAAEPSETELKNDTVEGDVSAQETDVNDGDEEAGNDGQDSSTENDDNSESDTDTKKQKKKTNPKVVIGVACALALVFGGIVLVNKSNNTQQQVQITNEELRQSLEAQIADLEQKFVEFQETSVANITRRVNELAVLSNALDDRAATLEAKQSQFERVVTEAVKKNDFNAQLVEVLNNDTDTLKRQTEALKDRIKLLMGDITKLKNRSGSQTVKAVKKEPMIYALKSIEGYSLFNIELWGNEDIAVFTKGNQIKRFKHGESFGGYYIDTVDINAGKVSLTKSSKKYSIKLVR